MGYCFLTPKGAVRFAIVRHGYPVESLTAKLIKNHSSLANENETIYSLDNPPYEGPTQTELTDWAAIRYGIFYWGDYFGWA